MTKETVLEILVNKTMDYISQREKEERYRTNGKDYKVIAGEKTIRNFINSKLVVESDSQIKKIINYIVFKNMSA